MIEPQVFGQPCPAAGVAELRASMGPVRDDAGAWSAFSSLRTKSKPRPRPARRRRSRCACGKRSDATWAKASQRWLRSGRRSLALAACARTVSVLHADIRGYTTFAEGREPEEVADAPAPLPRSGRRSAAARGRNPRPLYRRLRPRSLECADARDRSMRWRLCREPLPSRRRQRKSAETLPTGSESTPAMRWSATWAARTSSTTQPSGDTVNIAARLQAAAGPGEVVCSDERC